jgi:hypothetical protein
MSTQTVCLDLNSIHAVCGFKEIVQPKQLLTSVISQYPTIRQARPNSKDQGLFRISRPFPGVPISMSKVSKLSFNGLERND